MHYETIVPMLQALGTNDFGAGPYAMQSNSSGADNTAVGVSAFHANTGGSLNTATGYFALNSTTGDRNTAIGALALNNNTSGVNNIAIGQYAANLVTGSNSDNIHIGTVGAAGDNGIIRIGGNTGSIAINGAAQTQFFVAGVSGVTVSGVPVLVSSTGQLGVMTSSRRFKKDIQDMRDASSGLMRLRPVTFRYKNPFEDGSKPLQYGLIAEEVAEVYPDLVAHSADGQIETVKYQVLDSMLLNEVQRQQKEIQGLESQLSAERRQNQTLQERLLRLEAAIEKMTGRVGLQ